MPAVMIGGATALQTGGSIFSGIMGKSAAKKQAEAIRIAQGKARDAITQYTDKATSEIQPWRDRGNVAGQTLSDLLSGKLDPNAVLKASSLFQFQNQEGSTAINRELKARGLYGSGAGLESLRKFENQLVGEEGQRQYDRLFQVSEQGRQAGTTIGNWDVMAGDNIANVEMRGGLGRAAAIAQGDNAFASGISGAVNSVAGGGMNYMNYKMLEPILAKLGGSKDSGMPLEQIEGIRQQALGQGIVSGTTLPLGSDAGMMSGVSWTSNAF